MTLTVKLQPVKNTEAISMQSNRIASIDILRALTMVLMIFVNDLWSLTNIPVWLLHTTADQDGMGLSDVIFPAFLFIVGMSIPFAINNRKKKGDSKVQILFHVLSRAAALLIMGVFLVNGENLNSTATGIPRFLYNALCCVSFVLIWNAYPSNMKSVFVWLARTTGVITLLILAFQVRGEQAIGFSVYWWGILGLIGWSYLVCSIIYAFAGNNLSVVVISWIFMIALSMAAMAGWISFGFLSFLMDPLSNGSLPFLTMGGIVVSTIYLHHKNENNVLKMLVVLSAISAVLFAGGLYTNKFWIIAKLGATPPWVLLCSGIAIITFIFIFWLADIKGKAHWFDFIKPAGTNTLLCYLVPYLAYAATAIFDIHWPASMLNGVVGLIKSFLFAMLCVWIAWALSKRGIQLKL